MKQTVLMEKYPAFALDLPKAETSCSSVDEVIAALKAKIDADPKVAYIATFDHCAHTKAIGGTVADSILAAQNIVFCFGMMLPGPQVLAVRPRAIGVADMGAHFHITFLEPPMEMATTTMLGWVKELANKA